MQNFGLIVWGLILYGRRLNAQQAFFGQIFDVPPATTQRELIYQIRAPTTCLKADRTALAAMFYEMQDASQLMVNFLNIAKDGNVDAWSGTTGAQLLSSLFGIYPTGDGSDNAKIGAVSAWSNMIQARLSTRDGANMKKPRIYCNSRILKFMEPEDLVPSRLAQWQGQTARQYLGEERTQQNWAFFMPDQGPLNEAGLPKGNYLLLSKERWPGQGGKPFPMNNRPETRYTTDFCAQEGASSWSILPQDPRDHPILILCSHFFTRKTPGTYNPLPKHLNLAPQPVGKSLLNMEPKWLDFYHELFHLFIPEARGDPDWYKLDWAVWDQKGHEAFSDPNAWTNTFHLTHDPWQCMQMALRDQGLPPVNTDAGASSIDHLSAIKNPETFAWFAVAYRLFSRGESHQDWSSGFVNDLNHLPANPVFPPGIHTRPPQMQDHIAQITTMAMGDRTDATSTFYTDFGNATGLELHEADLDN